MLSLPSCCALRRCFLTRHLTASWLCSLLQGYGMGSWEWGLAHILSFVGSFFAITVTTAWSVISQFTGNSQYPAYWVFGLISLIGFVVGAMGLPALVIFPLYAWR